MIAAPVHLDAIPNLLKGFPQWVAWRREEREGKPTKVPYDVKTDMLARVNDPSTWAPFSQATAVLDQYDGIGFVLTPDDPFVGVDLDHVIDPVTGKIEPWATAILDQLHSYSEISPSGTGLRIFLQGSLPLGGRRKGPLELYDSARYLTVTGHHVAGTPRTIEPRHETLQRVHAAHFPAPINGHEPGPTQPVDLDDQHLLDKMLHALNGERVRALWNGSWSLYPSQSEGDMALCHHLAFWCGRDETRMDRLFRQSGLMREKWDARRGRRTYGEETIAQACARCIDTYQPVRTPIEASLKLPPCVLDDVYAYLGRFVAYPSEAAHVAHALWIGHAHLMEKWESTPRLAFLSPEPGSGKTRAMELTETLVPRPVEAINTTSAYLFRKISDPNGLPTVLHDEIDTIFGPRAKEHEGIRGVINAGHRRGASAGRCVAKGKQIETEELPAFCAVALADLGNLPDTILSRSIIIKTRRRAPGEVVEPYRRRVHAPERHQLRDWLAAWTNQIRTTIDTYPAMPDGITDRNADVWESLLSLADAAGGSWPERARASAVSLVSDAKGAPPSLGIRLLGDLRIIFGDRDSLWTVEILVALINLDESPWGDLKGKPLDARRLANVLKPYGVVSKQVRIGDKSQKGYTREALYDSWARYLPVEESGGGVGVRPSASETSETADTKGTPNQDELLFEEDPPC